MNYEQETALLRKVHETDDPVFIPIVFFSITDLCNSKCITCDYWKTEEDGTFLDHRRILETIDALSEYHLKIVYFTGGETLLKAKELFEVTPEIRRKHPNLQLRLYTNGILIHKYLTDIVENFDMVNVSIDSFDPKVYRDIRGINALPLIIRNIRALREKSPDVIIRINTVVQKSNYRELPQVVEQAESIGATHITFLPLDFNSDVAFARMGTPDLKAEVLGIEEVAELEGITLMITSEDYLQKHPVLREKGRDLRRVVEYYQAVNGLRPTAIPECNTPKTSVIVDSHGHVRLCFFTETVGSLQSDSIYEILGSAPAKAIKHNVQEGTLERCNNCACPIVYQRSYITPQVINK